MSFESYNQQGYFLMPTKADKTDGSFEHFLCGKHAVKGAECPNCKKPLLLYFQFDLHDPRLTLKNREFSLLKLFFCWRCELACHPFIYKVIGDDEIRIIEFSEGAVETDFPYDNYPDFFPQERVDLIQLSSKEQSIIHAINPMSDERDFDLSYENSDLDVPRHQFGGEPYLFGWHETKCPECRRNMSFFAALGDRAGGGMSFVKNEFVQVVFQFCGQCCMVGVYQTCD